MTERADHGLRERLEQRAAKRQEDAERLRLLSGTLVTCEPLLTATISAAEAERDADLLHEAAATLARVERLVIEACRKAPTHGVQEWDWLLGELRRALRPAAEETKGKNPDARVDMERLFGGQELPRRNKGDK